MSVFTRRLTPRHSLAKLAIAQIDSLALRQQDIIQAMGYQPKNVIQACDRLRHVLCSPTLGLDNSYYDFRFSSIEFLQTLLAVLQIPPVEYEAAIAELQHELENRVKPPVYTLRAQITFDFTGSANNWLTRWGVNRFHYVELPDNFIHLNESEQELAIQATSQAHYQQNYNNLPYDGVITGYLLKIEQGEEQTFKEFGLPNSASSL